MTVVLDPNDPSRAFQNRTGLAIMEIVGSGHTQVSATLIEASCCSVVALVSVIETDDAVKLSSVAEHGDTTEVHAVDGSVNVFPHSGGVIIGNSANASISVEVGAGRIFRKAGGNWLVI